MYHPMLVFERYTGYLLAARLRPGTASRHARIVSMLPSLLPHLQSAFPVVGIKLRAQVNLLLAIGGLVLVLTFRESVKRVLLPAHLDM